MKRAEVLEVKCPTCNASVDEPCVVKGKMNRGGFHPARDEKAFRMKTFGVLGCERKAIDTAPRYPDASTGQIALISCASAKTSRPAAARDLYTSALFRKSVRYVTDVLRVPWFVLSARHGLVHPDVELVPYDQQLTTMRKVERSAWCSRVRSAVNSLACWEPTPPATRAPDYRRAVTVLGGDAYASAVRAMPGYAVHEPMRKLMVGQRLAWLNERLNLQAAVATEGDAR